jgi:hypothetical protein
MSSMRSVRVAQRVLKFLKVRLDPAPTPLGVSHLRPLIEASGRASREHQSIDPCHAAQRRARGDLWPLAVTRLDGF